MTMNRRLSQRYLEKVPVFQGMPEDSLNKLVELAETVEYPRNRIIVNAGDSGDSMYVILEGSLKVYQTDSHGKQIVFAILTAGNYFGEMSLLDGKERSASIATKERSTLLRIGKKEFDALVADSPSFCKHLLIGLCERLRAANTKIANLAHMDVYGRVAGLLMESSEHCGDHYVVREHLTHQEIADRIGSSREMVSKILRDLSFGRYISQEQNKNIIIHKHLPHAW